MAKQIGHVKAVGTVDDNVNFYYSELDGYLARLLPGVDTKRFWNDPALARCVVDRTANLAGVHQQLLGHTSANDAGTTPAVGLGDRNTRAMLGGHARCSYASRSTADHEEVHIEAGHARSVRVPAHMALRELSEPTPMDRTGHQE